MIRKISNIIYISVLAVVLLACGDDSTIEEQGSGTITARVMASNAYPALEEKVVLKVALNDGQDIQSVVWTMEGQTLGEEPELEYTFTKEGSYNISVRVTDKTGNVAAALQKLQVSGKSLRYALQHFDPAKVWIMGKFRHLDEVAETLLLNHVVRHVKFKIRRLLGKYRRPSVETPYVLPFQLLRAQVLEQQVQFSQ